MHADFTAELGDLTSPTAATNLRFDDPTRDKVQQRVGESAQYLADHLERAPVFLVPCFVGRIDGQPSSAQAGTWGSILPAVWSFMLAARARGLGTALTTMCLRYDVGRRPQDPYSSSPGLHHPGSYTLGRLQARAPGTAGDRRALEQLVSRGARPRERRQAWAPWAAGNSASSIRTSPVEDGSMKAMRAPPWPMRGVSSRSFTPLAFNSASAPSMSSTSKQM